MTHSLNLLAKPAPEMPSLALRPRKAAEALGVSERSQLTHSLAGQWGACTQYSHA